MVRAVGFPSGRSLVRVRAPVFAKNADFFMIFEVYSRPGPGRERGNVTKEFKLVLESAIVQKIYNKNIETILSS